MKCPTCQSRTHVIETRQHSPTAIRRRRECLNRACRHRVTTEEVVIVVARPDPKLAAAKAAEMAAERRARQADARRRIEEMQMMKDLGLSEGDEYPEDL